jgi:fructan beta-fructosidase
MSDDFRPLYHFTPKANWINDPNGLVWFEGEYHLFYQYNPNGDLWGHMSWGHAVSTDLITWTELPLAIAEDDRHMIFSGSAVVDWHNASGFGDGITPPLVAAYTGAERGDGAQQSQCLAHSVDRGRTWHKYAGNPVLDIGLAHFRDPKVFWHEGTGRWIMVVVASEEDRALLYASDNLREWQWLSDIGPFGAAGGLWECPDLFELPVENKGSETRWLFKVDVMTAEGRDGSATIVITGLFDGTHFMPDEGQTWADGGRDFYAAISWSDIPQSDGRRIWIGWMSNHLYGSLTPTHPWRGAMTVPRSLSLRADGARYILLQRPVREVEAYRGLAQLGKQEIILAHAAFDMDMIIAGDAEIFISSDDGRYLKISINRANSSLSLDRSSAGLMSEIADFAVTNVVPLQAEANDVRILCDHCSLEIFADGGASVLTALHFLTSGRITVSVASAGAVWKVWSLSSVVECDR